MLLKKQVRGGVLLYALFMAGIFTLLLQVYLERVVASSRQNQAQMSGQSKPSHGRDDHGLGGQGSRCF